jgi:hypothetical protein
MIQASKRREAPASGDLNIHQTMARRRNWNTRLTLSSLTSCLVSLLLWLSGVPILIHLGILALVFVLGLAWPQKSVLPWVMTWIAERIGLSYQTALEFSEPDPYGFHSAVRQRALEQSKKLSLPSLQAWWLPGLAIAALLALIPFSPLRSLERPLGLDITPQSQSSSQPNPTPESAGQEQLEEQETVEAPQQTPDLPTANASPPPVLDEFDGASGQGADEQISERVADEEALSHFLQNLREREEQSANPFSDLNSSQQSASGGEQSDAENTVTRPGQGESQQGENTDGSESSQNGEANSQEGQEGQAAEEGEEGNASAESQQSQSNQSNPGDANQADVNGQPQGSGPDAAQNQNPRGLEGEANESAGNAPSASNQDALSELADRAEDNPDFLQGQLGLGPTNLAGTIRLPGSSDETASTFPAVNPNFQPSSEQALTEGRIPVEYQEIIRNYFK